MAEGSTLDWSMGFRNRATGKYISQETFNFALIGNGPSLKKKQIFCLQSAGDGVFIKTPLNRFMSGQSNGALKGDAEQPTEEHVWKVETQPDGTWALKSKHGLYLTAKGEALTAFAKELPADLSGHWAVHLAMHPQINLLNVASKRYVALRGGELCAAEDVPWGADALLTLIFFEQHPSGRYGLMACTGEYLQADGKLSKQAGPETQFLLGFNEDCVTLRDERGNYLSIVGAQRTLKTVRDKLTKDALFNMSDSEPQFSLKCNAKSLYLSVRGGGGEAKVDQAAVADTEFFQLEIDPRGSGRVAFKASNGLYLSVGKDGTITAAAKAKADSEFFTVQWPSTLVAASGQYVRVRPTGVLAADVASPDATSAFTLTLINRPELVLRGPHGFVGVHAASGKLEVHHAHPDTFVLEPTPAGTYRLHAAGGRAWTVEGGVVMVAAGGRGSEFLLEFVERSRFLIKHKDSGMYLEGDQVGSLKATGTKANPNTLWEY